VLTFDLNRFVGLYSFIVRDFTYDAGQVQAAAREKKELEEDYKKKHVRR
jgi:hypothetical protein